MTAWRLFVAEDEPPARERLLEALARVAPEAHVVGTADSVRAAAQWLATHDAPDLALLDIRLADGLSLELFRAGAPLGPGRAAVPVVFTTAYDQFALQAFQALAVDYLLKPVADAALAAALGKAQRLRQAFRPEAASLGPWLERNGPAIPAPPSGSALPASPAGGDGAPAAPGAASPPPPQRLLGRVGQRFHALPLEQAAYAVSLDKISVVVARDGSRLRLDEPLAELEARLAGAGWFRASRQLLLSPHAVRSFVPAERGRLKVQLEPPAEGGDTTISAERAAAFRAWLSR